MAENYFDVRKNDHRTIGARFTHAGESTISKVDAESVENQAPGLRVFRSSSYLAPLEFFCHLYRPGFVFQCSLYCNSPFGFGEENCLGGRVRKNEGEDDAVTRSDSSEHEEQNTPALKRRRRMSDTPCNKTTNYISNTVTNKPGCLSDG